MCPSGCNGDPTQPAPPPQRRRGRNSDWDHVNNADVLSMPDKWEYPWFAAWDLAFHCLPLALIDPEFAKEQLVLLTREWYSTRTVSCRPTNGISATSTRRSMPGRRGGYS